MKDAKIQLCSDACKHCIYIEDGDFICDVTQDVTIVSWKPFTCSYPKRKSKCDDGLIKNCKSDAETSARSKLCLTKN